MIRIYNLLKKGTVTLLLLLIVNFIFEYFYLSYVTELFHYMGFKLDFNLLKYIESKIMLLLILYLMNKLESITEIGFTLIGLIVFIVFIPHSIVYSFSNYNRDIFYFLSIAIFTLMWFSTHKINIISISISNFQLYLLIGIGLFLLFFPIFKDFGLDINFRLFLFEDTLETRAHFKENRSFASSYFFSWLGKAVIPVAIIFGLKHKRYIFSLGAWMMLVYLYLISGLKAVYVSSLVISLYYFFGKSFTHKLNVTLFLFVVVLLVIKPIDLLIGRTVLESIFVRRVFFIPSMLTQNYFEFFDGKPIYMAHSILKSFIDYPYSIEPANLIGEAYYRGSEVNANNGFISDGFMNFGIPGIFIYIISLGLVFSFLNSYRFPKEYFGLYLIYIMAFRGVAFTTVFLTHGFIIFVFLAFVFQNKNK